MVMIEVKVRKWGNSFGVTIPKEIVKKENFKDGQKVDILIFPKTNVLRELFGSMKNWKIDTQKALDELDRGEND